MIQCSLFLEGIIHNVYSIQLNSNLIVSQLTYCYACINYFYLFFTFILRSFIQFRIKLTYYISQRQVIQLIKG